MIKIEKDLDDIPSSLTRGNIIGKRNSVITNGYPTSNNSPTKEVKEKANKKVREYNKKYKSKDILDKLDSIYNSKCCYCESKITRVNADNLAGDEEKNHTVEHYRPKSKYPWLAYSWDNLLWCCQKCNTAKDKDFDIENPKAEYNESFLENIHTSSESYNNLEKPKFIYPELEDIVDEIKFTENGEISSDNDKVQYTITKCELDRPYLNTERKKILDELQSKFYSQLLDDGVATSVISDFMSESSNNRVEYKAFRSWIKNNLKTLIGK